ncbi:MAG: hypothetical protein GWO24_03325 [Akkermansiaceae bacterium]|nr:hypothetical protein [Akkermansiaceae bacterium]
MVADRDAFEAEYGTDFPIGGEFSGSLDNDGEQLTLRDASGAGILDFTYNDSSAWPVEADGNGPSLVLRAPGQPSDLNDPLNWRDSTEAGGNPASSDATTFTGNPAADQDQDGMEALFEYALGTSDTVPGSPAGLLLPDLQSDGHLTITIRTNLLASDLADSLEHSGDLLSWSPLSGFNPSEIRRDAANGTALIVYRSRKPVPSGPQRDFLRRRVTKR